MRIRTVIGLTVAGGAAVVAAGLGGSALAAEPVESAVPAVAEVSPAAPRGDGAAGVAAQDDCPWKGGESGAPADTGPAGTETL
ncbi:hypothetical protein ACQP2Y_16800 [Actinoplanes sp. CA-051413]|uniref:hypothetical protein n=1 Tax=Actinoplanes sp. CA-051413 TaxID=3239899 RepID=UPI003D9666DF